MAGRLGLGPLAALFRLQDSGGAGQESLGGSLDFFWRKLGDGVKDFEGFSKGHNESVARRGLPEALMRKLQIDDSKSAHQTSS